MVEERSSKAVGMAQQSAWTRWEQAVERKITWADLWRAECREITVLSMYLAEKLRRREDKIIVAPWRPAFN